MKIQTTATFLLNETTKNGIGRMVQELGTNKIYLEYFWRSGREIKCYSGKSKETIEELLNKAQKSLTEYNKGRKEKVILWSY